MSFATELTRAAAQRGKLDPLYRELSDDWTLILQQLFPVWALIGPGLAEPGHIELRSRTVYLDSDELLGPAAQIRAGQLERRAILRTYGVAIHEVLHAKHTKLWVTDRENSRIQIFDQDGTFQKEIKYAGLPCSLLIRKDGITMVNGFTGQILELDLDGKVLGVYGKAMEFGEAHNVAVSPKGEVFVGDVTKGILKFVKK